MENQYEQPKRAENRALLGVRALENYIDRMVQVDAEGAITKIRFDERLEQGLVNRLLFLYERDWAMAPARVRA